MTRRGERNLARQLTQDRRPRIVPELALRQAVVQSIDTGPPPSATVRVGGSTVDIAGVRWIGVPPEAGDTVWVLRSGHDLLIIGRLNDDNGPPWAKGEIKYEEVTSSSPGFTSETDLVTVTFTAEAGRKYRITGVVTFTSTSSGDIVRARLRDDATGQGDSRNVYIPSSTNGPSVTTVSRRVFPAGQVELRLTGERVSGSGTITGFASDFSPMSILVEDIGPA